MPLNPADLAKTAIFAKNGWFFRNPIYRLILVLQTWFIAHFNRSRHFPISVSYIVWTQLQQKWLNQPFLVFLAKMADFHNSVNFDVTALLHSSFWSEWTNQPLFNDIVTSKTIHYTNPWLQGEAWYILLVTLYTLMGLYGHLDKHFKFYCAWDILKAFSFQPYGFMLPFELTMEFGAREACVMDIWAYRVLSGLN